MQNPQLFVCDTCPDGLTLDGIMCRKIVNEVRMYIYVHCTLTYLLKHYIHLILVGTHVQIDNVG